MTSIADIIAIARDMALDALDRGEPVAWVTLGRRSQPELWRAKRGEFVSVWWSERLAPFPYAFKRSHPAEWVRDHLLGAVAILSPEVLTEAIESWTDAREESEPTIETTTTVRPRLPEPTVPGVYTNPRNSRSARADLRHPGG